MNKNKVTIGIVAAIAVSAIAFQQLSSNPEPEIKAAEQIAINALVSKPAPSQKVIDNSPPAPKPAPQPQHNNISAESNDEVTIVSHSSDPRKTVTARKEESAVDHQDPRSQARPHGHEHSHDINTASQPPGVPNKPVPKKTPRNQPPAG
ncbi:hypothetical protein [Litorilituus lipolyticus]|uniref:Uncharacterized protein n=1 Tax=Litorilituus lipolyticus TaxID=2491017 RepID=A0A502LES4_9GAMM|nr:hypothetical protein [Litorilituus lipolyticus]TPH18477.1 hypothetical protein EPA86_01545 [Litorilituus lipolyticus]